MLGFLLDARVLKVETTLHHEEVSEDSGVGVVVDGSEEAADVTEDEYAGPAVMKSNALDVYFQMADKMVHEAGGY